MRKRWIQATASLALAGMVGLGAPSRAAHAADGGVALVVGEAAYANLPALSGCALSAHAVAAALRGLGFAVDEQVDAGSAALYSAVGAFQRKLAATKQAPGFLYACLYATAYAERPFVLPATADLTRPADVLTQGVLAKSLLDALVAAKPAISVLALDAVTLPNDTAPAKLETLLQPAMPASLGYIAVTGAAQGNAPLPLAAALVPALHAPVVQGSDLLAGLGQQLAGVKTASVAALHAPDAGLYLAGAPAPPPPPPVVTAPPSPLPVAPPAPPPPAVAPVAPAPAVTLPDEDRMTDAQRRQVQRALAHLGYYDGQPDGVFGPETRAAIRRFQHEARTPMTGHLTSEEASKLAATWG